jgi:hypothetical protein
MEHKPSKYEGSITLTFQQMVEVHKAISARIADLMTRDDYEHKEQEIDELLAVAQMLDYHEWFAISEWEKKIVAVESEQLNDEEAVKKFLENGD